jgi:hypothetical protein
VPWIESIYAQSVSSGSDDYCKGLLSSRNHKIRGNNMINKIGEKWHSNPVITAIVSAILTGILSFGFFVFTRTVDNGNNISGDSVKIQNLTDKVESLEQQITTLQTSIAGGYVSQSTFAEFKSHYEQDQLKLQGNDGRIENKLDTLLMEHAKPAKATAAASTQVAAK